MTLEVLNHCCGIISYLPLTSHIPLNLNSLADSLLLAPISRSSKLMFINPSFESLACVKMKDDKGIGTRVLLSGVTYLSCVSVTTLR